MSSNNDIETTTTMSAEFAGLEGKTAVLNASGENPTNQVPLYMREGGEEEIDKRRKELEIYVKMLKDCPPEMINRTFIMLNPHTLNPNEVGEKEADRIEKWWLSDQTRQNIFDWLRTNNHKVNGKFGNWSAGFMGSRWADCKINGRNCRFAFYSRKHNPSSFPPEMDASEGKKYNYALMIDPTL